MKKKASLFWNQEENRVRAGWRVLMQMILTAGLLAAVAASGFFNGGKFQLTRIEMTLVGIGVSVLVFMTVFVDKRRFRDLGVNLSEKHWWSDLGLGVFLGLFQTVVFLFVARSLDWVTIEPVFRANSANVPLMLALLMDVVAFISVAIMEELVRAYQLRNVAEGVANTAENWRLGLLIGGLVASLFSVAMHLNQHGPGFWAYVFLCSVIYCLAFCLTGRVAMAMGLHFAWDFLSTTVVSLGGTGGINAAVLFSAPLTLEGNLAYMRSYLDLLGLALQIPLLALMLAWVRIRYGKINLKKALVTYSLREALIDENENEGSKKVGLENALR